MRVTNLIPIKESVIMYKIYSRCLLHQISILESRC